MLNLGQIINQLEKLPQQKTISFDFCRAIPNKFNSFRGYYRDLAIQFTHDYESITVEAFLNKAKECVGKEFTGYKGGEYVMSLESRVWVAEYGSSSETRISMIKEEDCECVIHTAYANH